MNTLDQTTAAAFRAHEEPRAEATATELPHADDRPTEVIERALATAHEMLGMDVAYVADTRAGLQDYRCVTGDVEAFGAHAGDAIPLEGTYCEALLDGRLDNIVRDSSSDPVVRNLKITAEAGIGSYIGVPVILSDGDVYGTFCCVSRAPNPSLQARDVRFMEVLARLIGDQLEHEERQAEQHRLALTAGNVGALLAALEARDGYTEAHSQAVVELARSIGRRLCLSEPELLDIEHAALLHDIGKIGISDAVLRKPGSLDDDEWAEMQRHPEIGARIVAGMPHLAHLAPAIRAEHERWDGNGYPDELTGTQIPIASRIVFVCDAYHAMTSDRPYRKALSRERALSEIAQNAGSQFCPQAAQALLDTVTGDRHATHE